MAAERLRLIEDALAGHVSEAQKRELIEERLRILKVMVGEGLRSLTELVLEEGDLTEESRENNPVSAAKKDIEFLEGQVLPLVLPLLQVIPYVEIGWKAIKDMGKYVRAHEAGLYLTSVGMMYGDSQLGILAETAGEFITSNARLWGLGGKVVGSFAAMPRVKKIEKISEVLGLNNPTSPGKLG